MRRGAPDDELYFLTMTVVDWVDIFTRLEYKQYLVDNLRICEQKKGLTVFAYVIMTNHMHLLAQVEKGQKMSDWLRDFKSFTSKGLYRMVTGNPQESRRDWMKDLFLKHGSANELNKEFQIWQNGSFPTPIEPNHTSMLLQKLEYIHQNPVRAGFVSEASDYLFSSAHPDNPLGILPWWA